MVFITREGATAWAKANRKHPWQQFKVLPVVKSHSDLSASFGFIVRFK